MIIVNYFRDEDYNHATDGYHLHLAAVANDVLSLNSDIDLITEAIDNDPDFEPKNGVLYEIYLDRATIAADPYCKALTNHCKVVFYEKMDTVRNKRIVPDNFEHYSRYN